MRRRTLQFRLAQGNLRALQQIGSAFAGLGACRKANTDRKRDAVVVQCDRTSKQCTEPLCNTKCLLFVLFPTQHDGKFICRESGCNAIRMDRGLLGETQTNLSQYIVSGRSAKAAVQ